MSRDDIRKLIGGYATGTLTESERKLLFEAALEDQDLFDELAHEQALKEALEQPGAKQRLIASLEPEPRIVWWRRPLVLSGAGAVAIAVIGLSWILQQRPQTSVQIAKVEEVKSPPPASAPVVAQPPVSGRAEKRAASKRDTAPPPANEQKAKPVELAKKADEPLKDQTASVSGDIKELDRLPRAAAPPPPQAPQIAGAPPPAAPQQTTQTVQVQAATAQTQTQNASPAQTADQSRASQGFVAGTTPTAARLRVAPSRAEHFALDYSLENQELVIKFAADGYFYMHFSPGLDTIVGVAVKAGSTRREHIPNNATEASILFVVSPQITSGGVSLTREDKSGRVEDLGKERIELLLRFYP